MGNLINFLNLWGFDTFDSIALPDGMNKDLVIATIIDECDEFEPIYTTKDLFKLKTEIFFMRNFNNFEKLYKMNNIEYNPLENYNKDETISRDVSKDDVTGSTTTENGTNTTKVSAYNVTDFKDSSQNVDSNSNKNDATYKGKEIESIKNLTKGNIGVMSTQDMFLQEVNLQKQFNLYKFISEMYFKEFFIQKL